MDNTRQGGGESEGGYAHSLAVICEKPSLPGWRRFGYGQTLFNADPPVGVGMMAAPFRLFRTPGLARPKVSDALRWQVSWLAGRRRRPAFPAAIPVAVEVFR